MEVGAENQKETQTEGVTSPGPPRSGETTSSHHPASGIHLVTDAETNGLYRKEHEAPKILRPFQPQVPARWNIEDSGLAP